MFKGDEKIMINAIVKNNKNLTPLAASLALILGIGVSFYPLYASIAIGGVIAALIFFLIPLRIIFSLVSLTIFIDVSPISLFGSYLRISQILYLFFFIRLLFNAAIKSNLKSSAFPLKKTLILWYGSLLLAWNHLLSKTDLTVILIGQGYLYLLFYGIFYYYNSQSIEIQINGIRLFIIGGIAIVLIGVLELPFIQVGIIEGYDRGIGTLSPSSLMREPDWYGMVAMYIGLFLISLIVTKSNVLKIKNMRLIFMLCCFALIISMARAAIIAFLIGMVVLYLFSDKKTKAKFIKSFLALVIVLVLGFSFFYAFNAEKSQVLLDRFNPATTLNNDNGAANSRIASIQVMLYFIKQHPWTGNGAGGMVAVGSMTDLVRQFIDGDINAGRGNANLILTSLFDSGIIGTFFLLIALGIYFKKMYQRYKETKDPIILALLITFIALFTEFMFNNGIRFSFFWFHLAISFGYIYRKQNETKITQAIT